LFVIVSDVYTYIMSDSTNTIQNKSRASSGLGNNPQGVVNQNTGNTPAPNTSKVNVQPQQQINKPDIRVGEKPAQPSVVQPIQSQPALSQSQESKAFIITPPTDDSKKSILLVVIGILFLIILSTGGFYLYTRYTTQDSEEMSQNLTGLPTPVVKTQPTEPMKITDPTKEWQVYVDPDGYYELKYPDTFERSDYTEESYVGVSFTYLGTSRLQPESEMVDGVIIRLLIIDEVFDDFSVFVEQRRDEEEIALRNSEGVVVGQVVGTALGGRSGYEYSVVGTTDTRVIYIDLDGGILKASVEYGGVESDVAGYQETADRILGTFRVLVPSEMMVPTSTDSAKISN
jgi:hypothetical protein